MITIEMGNVFSRISGIKNEDIHYIIADALSYRLNGFSVDKSQQFLYNPENGMTYTGLVPHVLTKLQELKTEYKIVDKRVVPKQNASFRITRDYAERDYQSKIIRNASSREIIQAATGAGKTRIMGGLIEKWLTAPILVVAPKISLAEQIKEEFEKFFRINIGLVGGGKRTVHDITVGTPQSLIEDPITKKAKGILFDECHNLPARTIFDVAKNAVNAFYRQGMSATPWRDGGDDILIEAALNIRKPSLNITASMLIAKGRLVPCTINFVPIDSGSGWLGNYSDTYEKVIVNNNHRNRVIVDIAKKSLLTRNATLILISKIEHGNIILDMIKQEWKYEERGYCEDGHFYKIGNIEFVSGEDDTARRRAVFQAVRDGFCKILIGSTIADEGLDIPILDTLILAGAGKSSTRAFQRIGRILRLHALKKDAIAYDFYDSNETFYKQAEVRHALYSTESLWKINILSNLAA